MYQTSKVELLDNEHGFNTDYLTAKLEDTRRDFMKKVGSTILGVSYEESLSRIGEPEDNALSGNDEIKIVKTDAGSYGFIEGFETGAEVTETIIESLFEASIETTGGIETARVRADKEELFDLVEKINDKGRKKFSEQQNEDKDSEKYSQDIDEWLGTTW